MYSSRFDIETAAEAVAHINCRDYYAVERDTEDLEINKKIRIIKAFYVYGTQRDSIVILLDGINLTAAAAAADSSKTIAVPTNFLINIRPSFDTLTFFHKLESLFKDPTITTFVSYTGINADPKQQQQQDSKPIYDFSYENIKPA